MSSSTSTGTLQRMRSVPVLLRRLLPGTAIESRRLAPGIEFAARSLLRVGVALPQEPARPVP